MIECFCKERILLLDRDDVVSLGLFFSFQLASFLGLGETAAELVSSFMMNSSEKTIREWRGQFFQNEGQIQESTLGKYQRSGTVWLREDLNKISQKYIRKNADVRRRPNLTIRQFCNWVNEDLLPN